MKNLTKELSVIEGCEISKIEVVSVCHMLRLYMADKYIVDFPASWRVVKSGKIAFGCNDIDFYYEYDEEQQDQDDAAFSKKCSKLLVGKSVSSISDNDLDIKIEIGNNLYIDLYRLSSDETSIILREL